MVKAMGGEFKRILLVGCEPETLGREEGQMGLSAPVEAAVGEAVRVVESLVAETARRRERGGKTLSKKTEEGEVKRNG